MTSSNKLTDSNFTNYQLGIIYSIGSYIPSENIFTIRHKDKHYVNTISTSVKSTPYKQPYNNSIQYVIKISNYKPDLWNTHLSDERQIPRLKDYSDFLRAYIEIHSKLDYSTNYTRKFNTMNLWLFIIKILIILILNKTIKIHCNFNANLTF